MTQPDDSGGQMRPAKGAYGVRLVRGPVVNPGRHPLAVDTLEELRSLLQHAYTSIPRAVDLFCGAGGMSLGLEKAGYGVVLGVDQDEAALDTHRSLAPGLSARWDLGDPVVVQRIGELVRDLDISLLAGGPPCQPFSKAGRSMLRHLVETGRRDAEDLRAHLWRSMIRVVEIGRPQAVLMENVPDMVLDRDMLVLRTMTDELESIGYSVQARLVDTWRYGVPQFRQRLMLVALRDGARFEWPPEQDPVRLIDAIDDLPRVEGGWRPEGGADGWLDYTVPDVPNAFVEEMRRVMVKEDVGRIHDHITRPVRDDDREAFAFMDSGTKYSDLPENLQRYRNDIFDDKYKRLDWHDFCRTITAHIAKDGYWYIHPDQERTLTVREAARVQTFPDHVRFAGPPTAAFRQIGNAVPPAAAAAVASAIRTSVARAEPAKWDTREVSRGVAAWMSSPAATVGGDPRRRDVKDQLRKGAWPEAGMRWTVLLTHLLFPRIQDRALEDVWQVVTNSLGTPEAALAEDRLLAMLARTAGRGGRLAAVRETRDALLADPSALATPEGLEGLPNVSRALARMVCRVVPGPDSDPVLSTAPLLRVAARFHGSSVDNEDKQSSGRLAIATLVGVDGEEGPDEQERFRAALASLALLEIADSICLTGEPECARCPLRENCDFAAHNAVQLQMVPEHHLFTPD